MDERHRFAVALASVTGCLCLAAGIAMSGPYDAIAPSVDHPQTLRLEPLPRWPVPSWTDVPPPTPLRPAAARPRGLVRAAAVMDRPTASAKAPAPPGEPLESPAAAQQTQRSLPTHRLTQPLLVHRAPDAVGADVVVAEHRARHRGAVTGAFVTAGARVGGSVRTVGRTLRRVF